LPTADAEKQNACALKRDDAEIAKVTGCRITAFQGFISGTVTKKMGCVVESAQNDSGEHTYRIDE
jgi:hypothetical protein